MERHWLRSVNSVPSFPTHHVFRCHAPQDAVSVGAVRDQRRLLVPRVISPVLLSGLDLVARDVSQVPVFPSSMG